MTIQTLTRLSDLAGPREAKRLARSDSALQRQSRAPTASEGPSRGRAGDSHAQGEDGSQCRGGRGPLTELLKEGLHEAGPGVEVRCVHIQAGDFFGCEKRGEHAGSEEGGGPVTSEEGPVSPLLLLGLEPTGTRHHGPRTRAPCVSSRVLKLCSYFYCT